MMLEFANLSRSVFRDGMWGRVLTFMWGLGAEAWTSRRASVV